MKNNLSKLIEHKDDSYFFKYAFTPQEGDIQTKDEESGTFLFLRNITFIEAESRVRADEVIVVVKQNSKLGNLYRKVQE